ncbi:Putative nuclease [Cavenderia fasciculata]|uniref:Nuclease n=1 Tax=Cavenderia fasciculata TaxID=261658 RepID=F4PVC1_CACFS|nr:Putative nuclease [Cavenderia fasciculata]EGG19935.1 Putative nuclease [Cavenderia fasciculata]|eukprot:XP_004366918.1 Putative nuclease [Cavenderia fasciculata]
MTDQQKLQQQIINEVNNLMVMDYEIVQAKTNEPVSVQYFCNRDCEPLYFPDRTLATLLQVNLSTLRGRFNRLTKKYSGIRVLISEKSKARLTNYQFVSCQPNNNNNNNSNTTSPSSSSSSSSQTRNSPSPPSTVPPSPPLQSVVIAGANANYPGGDESGASSLHGLVALNHIDLVNHALSEWIALNHERLGTAIRDIEINLSRAKLSYIRHNDIITLLPKKYECPSPSSSPPTSPSHYSVNPYNQQQQQQIRQSNYSSSVPQQQFNIGSSPSINQFRSPSSSSSNNNNNHNNNTSQHTSNYIMNSGLNYLMNCSAVESFRLGSNYENGHGGSPCSSTSTQSPLTSPSEDDYSLKYSSSSSQLLTTPNPHKRIGGSSSGGLDYPNLNPFPSHNHNHSHHHSHHNNNHQPLQSIQQTFSPHHHHHNHQSQPHDYLYHVEQEHQRSLSTKKQKQQHNFLGNPTMSTNNPIIVDCSYENETTGIKKKIDLNNFSGFPSLFKFLESSFASALQKPLGDSFDIFWSDIAGNGSIRQRIDKQRDDLDWNDFLINVREIIIKQRSTSLAVSTTTTLSPLLAAAVATNTPSPLKCSPLLPYCPPLSTTNQHVMAVQTRLFIVLKSPLPVSV